MELFGLGSGGFGAESYSAATADTRWGSYFRASRHHDFHLHWEANRDHPMPLPFFCQANFTNWHDLNTPESRQIIKDMPIGLVIAFNLHGWNELDDLRQLLSPFPRIAHHFSLDYGQAAYVVFSSLSTYMPNADITQTSAQHTSIQCIQQKDGCLCLPTSQHTRGP